MSSRLSGFPTVAASLVLLSSLAANAFAAAPPARLADPARFPLPVTSLVVADLDGVSGLDLMGVNGANVSAVLNERLGNFGAPLTFSMGGTTLAAVGVGDLDGDGRNDLVAIASDTVIARLAGPGLVFGPPQKVPLPGSSTWGLELGDFDGDGRPDLVATCQGSQCIAALRNDGAGHLGAPLRIDVPGALSAPLLGDFNGDGFPDILVGLAYPVARLVLVAGHGDGTFDPPVTVSPPAPTPLHLAAGDLDGDGDLDVVSHGEGSPVVLPNQGSGTFGSPLPLGSYPGMYYDPVVADVDRDGHADIAFSTRSDWFGPVGFLTVLRNRGGLSFGPAASYAVGPNVTEAGIADLDGDGWPDGVAACGGLGNGGCSFPGFPVTPGVFVLHNSGAGLLDGMREVAEPVWLPVRSGAHTLPDLVGASPAGTMYRARNLGNGTFESAQAVGWGTPIAAQDLDGDGDEELLVTSADSTWVLPNLGATGFGAPTTTIVGFAFRDFAPFHGGTRLDLLATDANSELVMFPGDGAGGFGPPVDLGRNVGVGTGGDDVRGDDLNGDGFADVLYAQAERVGNPAGGSDLYTKLFALLNDRAGGLGPPDSSVSIVHLDYTQSISHGPGFLRLGDWNGDGVKDATHVRDACMSGNRASEQVFLGVGNGSFTMANSSSGNSPCDVRAADLNGDHLDDLVTLHSTSGCIFDAMVGSSDGTGSFPNGFSYPMGVQPVEVHLADLDGDGRLDVVTRNDKMFGARTYSIRRNVTPNSQPTPVLVSLVSSSVTGGVVRLDWFAAGTPAFSARVERRSGAGGWSTIAERYSDGTGHLRFEDREVVAGAIYGYRLRIADAEGELVAAETWVTVPGAALAVAVWPNPANDHPAITFTLPAAGAADLAVFDVAGRLVQRARVGELAAGGHRFEITTGLVPGIYVARLMFAGSTRQTRFVVTR